MWGRSEFCNLELPSLLGLIALEVGERYWQRVLLCYNLDLVTEDAGGVRSWCTTRCFLLSTLLCTTVHGLETSGARVLASCIGWWNSSLLYRYLMHAEVLSQQNVNWKVDWGPSVQDLLKLHCWKHQMVVPTDSLWNPTWPECFVITRFSGLYALVGLRCSWCFCFRSLRCVKHYGGCI